MKKIFTFLFAAGAISFVSAQSTVSKNFPFKDNKNMIAGYTHPAPSVKRTNGLEGPSFSFKENEAQIQRINREFDRIIMAVKKNRRMGSQEKSKKIRMLENERKQEISQVQFRFKKNGTRHRFIIFF